MFYYFVLLLIHYHLNFVTYSRSSSIAISICSFSIVNVICSVDYPNSRWSHCNLYSFSSNVLPVLSSPSIDILIFVDSPNMTVVTDIKLKEISSIKSYRFPKKKFIPYILLSTINWRLDVVDIVILPTETTHIGKCTRYSLPFIVTCISIDLTMSVDSPYGRTRWNLY